MLQVMLARVLLPQEEPSWQRLQAIEDALKRIYPDCQVSTGALGNPIMVSIAQHLETGQIQPGEIREFVARGMVTASRKEGVPPSKTSSAVAVIFALYPEPSIESLGRIETELRTVWSSQDFKITYGSVHHPGIPQQETVDKDIMQFEVERIS
jgi:hypothetical protein